MPSEADKQAYSAGAPGRVNSELKTPPQVVPSGDPATSAPSRPSAQLESMALMLRKLWQKNLPVLRSRLDLFNTVAAAADAGEMTDSMRLEAAGIAHKLAGALGTFGYAEGTRLARLMEAALAPEDGSAPDPATLRRIANDLRESLSLERVDE